jgi:hypothetical protein
MTSVAGRRQAFARTVPSIGSGSGTVDAVEASVPVAKFCGI